MRLILNVIWLLFGGLWLALGYLLAALICFVLIITIPFGFASLRIASYALWPFGRTVIETRHPSGRADRKRHLGHPVRHLAGRRPHRLGGGDGGHDRRHPLALANLKMVPISLVPLGKEIVPVDAIGAANRPLGAAA